MAGPAAVVIAGIVTGWLAIVSNDGLVADDYYKQGLAINQVLAREQLAHSLQLDAQVRVSAEAIEVALRNKALQPLPERLRVVLVHATRAGMDRSALLEGAGGIYRGAVQAVPPGRWRVVVEDEARTWRLTGAVRLPEQATLHIAAPQDSGAGKGE